MNQYKTSRSTNDALSLPALKNGVSRAKAMKREIMMRQLPRPEGRGLSRKMISMLELLSKSISVERLFQTKNGISKRENICPDKHSFDGNIKNLIKESFIKRNRELKLSDLTKKLV